MDNFLNAFQESDYGILELYLYKPIFYGDINTERLNSALAQITCGIVNIVRRPKWG